MQTSYELLLQPEVAGAAFARDVIEAVLRDRGAVTRGDGALVWKLKAGEVTVLPLRESGAITGLELKLPFSDRHELVSELLASAVDVARTNALRVVDPQLGRTVSEVDGGAITDEYLRISRYAGAYFGLGDALPVALPQASDDETVSPVMKAVLAVLVFGVAMAAACRYFSPA
ncbi:MAG: hypothetical protein MUC96_34645 [Myxococcaceae bacterium]|jgi:hypothetical protein|nr:hypothetical protein [Myxococcaceae bacterium]